MRFELQDLWLEQGRFEDVLRLAAAYPDDMPAMAYGRALALFASGRGEEAEAALCEAVRRGPKLIEWLLPEQRAEPPLDPRWTTVGGDDEAAERHPYQAAYLPFNRLKDGTVHDW